MPRSKKAASRGRGRGRGTNNGGREHMTSLDTSFVPFAGTGTRHGNDGHSLQSEAFQTQRNQSSWDSDRRLRHTKVKFVSAGDSNTLDPMAPETGLAHMTLNDSSKEMSAAPKAPIGDGDALKMDMPLDQVVSSTANDGESPRIDEETARTFIVDVKGGQPIITGHPPPQIRSTSPTPSNSSDEVIVFTGRDRAGRGLSKLQQTHKTMTDSYDSRIRIIEDRVKENYGLLAVNVESVENSSVDSVSGAQMVNEQEAFTQTDCKTPQLAAEIGSINSGSSKYNRSHHHRKVKRDREQALIDDYLSNMDKKDLGLGLSYNRRDLGGTDSDPWQETETSFSDPTKKLLVDIWEPSELRDLDALSTSDEIFGSVKAILSKRNRKSGQQYLVVWEDHSVDEARWVPISLLTDANSTKLIDQFEAEDKMTAESFVAEEEGRDSDSDSDHASGGDLEDSNDDSDLLQRKIDRMTDEKIAKLLAKQEELGMGSSELVLFDDSSEGDLERDMSIRLTPKLDRSAFRNVPAMNRAKGDFPAATALADAYDGFDVMDFERPSLKKKSKGRKGRLAFDLSDSELEESMAVAWDKNRSKKRERKDERQALRAQGLLGKKNSKPDLKAKYKEGIGIHAVKEEIKIFLMGDNTTLALPPMDKADRKVVHELANAFKLKSKSAGNGNKRFPVLYRTSDTTSPSEVEFAAIEARIARRYLPRTDLRGRNTWSASKRPGRGGFVSAGVSYRDGDIVGGSAPELGIDNKGRAMLEKMGWSTGTALGALNNKGILQPVSHIVKTTKAGLG